MSKRIPMPNRLIKCFGHDWSEFTCIGKWVPYKSPPNKPGSGRFMRQSDHGFVADRNTWHDIDRWEYSDEPKAEDSPKYVCAEKTDETN